jgi:hypothetical protein
VLYILYLNCSYRFNPVLALDKCSAVFPLTMCRAGEPREVPGCHARLN